MIKCYTVNNHLIFTKFSQQVVRAFYGKKRTNLSSVLHFLQIFLQTNTKIREKKIENIVRPVKKSFFLLFLIVFEWGEISKKFKDPQTQEDSFNSFNNVKKTKKKFRKYALLTIMLKTLLETKKDIANIFSYLRSLRYRYERVIDLNR